MGSKVNEQPKVEKPRSPPPGGKPNSTKSRGLETKPETEKEKKRSTDKKVPVVDRRGQLQKSQSEEQVPVARLPDRRQASRGNLMSGMSATLSRRNVTMDATPVAGRPAMAKAESRRGLLAGARKASVRTLMSLADDVLDIVLDDDTGKKKKKKLQQKKKEAELKKRSMSPMPKKDGKAVSSKSLSRRNLMDAAENSGKKVSRRNLMDAAENSGKKVSTEGKKKIVSIDDKDKVPSPSTKKVVKKKTVVESGGKLEPKKTAEKKVPKKTTKTKPANETGTTKTAKVREGSSDGKLKKKKPATSEKASRSQ